MRKHKSDLVILFSALALMAIGLIVIYAVGPMRANVLNTSYEGTNYNANDLFIGQLRSVILSVIALFAAFKLIKIDFIKKHAKLWMMLAIGASVLLFLLALAGSSLARCELGACRWFSFGGLSIQPAEFLKLALVIYLADFFARKKEEGTVGKAEFWVPFIIVSLISLILVVVFQKDLGTGISVVAIILGSLLMSGVPMKQYLVVLAIILIGGVGVIAFSGHRMDRIDAWMTTLTGGESDDSTYHVDNAMLAIGTGGAFGVGIGNSVQATGYLPETINDSIFAVMGEIFGFVGLTIIIIIFCAMLLRMLKVANFTADDNNRIIVVGVFSWIIAQVAANIMSMTALVPLTGVTLPLLSYGGTSMIFIAFALGLVLQLSCYTNREVIKNEDISSRRGLGGTHYSSRRRSERDSSRKTSRRG